MKVVRYKKKQIRKALREQVWLQYFGKCFDHKCSVVWCKNIITILNFHAGHIIPESKGGHTSIDNLRPICSNCNLSMGNTYSIVDWNNLGSDNSNIFSRCFMFLKYMFGY